jgi:hypothetical protein
VVVKTADGRRTGEDFNGKAALLSANSGGHRLVEPMASEAIAFADQYEALPAIHVCDSRVRARPQPAEKLHGIRLSKQSACRRLRRSECDGGLGGHRARNQQTVWYPQDDERVW